MMLSLTAFYGAAGCAHVAGSRPNLAGEYRAADDKSRVVLDVDGTYIVEDLNQEVPFELLVLGGGWTNDHDRVVLSWTDLSKEKLQSIREVTYTFSIDDGAIVLQLSEGQQLPAGLLENPMGVQLCKRYKKEPNLEERVLIRRSANRDPG